MFTIVDRTVRLVSSRKAAIIHLLREGKAARLHRAKCARINAEQAMSTNQVAAALLKGCAKDFRRGVDTPTCSVRLNPSWMDGANANMVDKHIRTLLTEQAGHTKFELDIQLGSSATTAWDEYDSELFVEHDTARLTLLVH